MVFTSKIRLQQLSTFWNNRKVITTTKKHKSFESMELFTNCTGCNLGMRWDLVKVPKLLTSSVYLHTTHTECLCINITTISVMGWVWRQLSELTCHVGRGWWRTCVGAVSRETAGDTLAPLALSLGSGPPCGFGLVAWSHSGSGDEQGSHV